MASPSLRTAGRSGDAESGDDRLAAEIERLRAELERLRESEKMYRFSAEISGRLVWSADPDGRVTAMSRMFAILSGISDQEAFETDWMQFVHEDDRGRVEGLWAESRRTGEPLRVEFRARVPDGSYRTILAKAVPVRDRDGRILRWYGSSEDVEDEREAERARRDVEERYRLAVEATNDAVWDYDIVNGTVSWSDNTSGIFGGGTERLGTTSIGWWEERIHPEDKPAVVRSLEEAIASPRTRWSATYRFRKEDGSYADVLDRGSIIRDPDGKPQRAVGAMVDLTERHRAEAEIRRMQAELIHVSRLSAMGTMASTLAHELNQPLAAVSNYLSGARRMAMESGEGRQEALLEALQAAETGTLRAGEIVRRLRELVSRGTVSAGVESLPKLIEEAGVLAFVDEKLRDIRHRLELDPAAMWVRADRIQVEQVLINLIRNAMEAMAGSAEREVVISTHARPGETVEVRVADTGSGIAPRLLDSLFSQFMTTKSGGMGIGLPICRTIIEAHGGKIWAENRAEGGAVFCFTLPRAKAKAKPR